MPARCIYLTDNEIEELKEIKVSIQDVFRQGYIIETVLQGTNSHLNNDFQKNKIKKLIEYHKSQIEGLRETIEHHQEQITKLSGGQNAIRNKEAKDNKIP
jgi:hypothetical protein